MHKKAKQNLSLHLLQPISNHFFGSITKLFFLKFKTKNLEPETSMIDGIKTYQKYISNLSIKQYRTI